MTEVLPGDTIQQASSALVRVSPLVSPVMHPVHVRIHHWFVPHRLVWENWESFITGGSDGMDASVLPFRRSVVSESGLGDYYGVPPGDYNALDYGFSALPFRGYNLIFNEWYRDQDLVPERVLSVVDGLDSTTEDSVASCAWEKDYFTTCRPWVTKGGGVSLPIGISAPVIPSGSPSPQINISGAPSGINVAASGAIGSDVLPAALTSFSWMGNTGLVANASRSSLIPTAEAC